MKQKKLFFSKNPKKFKQKNFNISETEYFNLGEVKPFDGYIALSPMIDFINVSMRRSDALRVFFNSSKVFIYLRDLEDKEEGKIYKKNMPLKFKECGTTWINYELFKMFLEYFDYAMTKKEK